MGKGLQIVILLIVVIIGVLYPLFVDNIKNTGKKTDDSFAEDAHDFISVTFRSFLGIPVFIIGMIVILLIPSQNNTQNMIYQPLYQPIPPPKTQYY